eukprot:scaffold14896_cov106-Skeletonema_marinoi.AAC.1
MLLHYHGQLEWAFRSCGLSYSQREIRYGCQQRSWRPSRMLHQVTYNVIATLSRRNDVEPCKRCFYTIKANYDGSLEAVDRHIYSERYDMAVNRGAGGHLRCLIRSPTTLYR